MEIEGSSLFKSSAFEKEKNMDVVLSVKDHILNLEMNRKNMHSIRVRNDMFHHSLVSKSVEMGIKYENFPSVFQLNFDYEDGFNKTISEFKVMEVDTHEVENEAYKKYHINLLKIVDKYYNEEELSEVEKYCLVLALHDRKDLNTICNGDDKMEEAEKKLDNPSTKKWVQELLSDDFQEKLANIERQVALADARNEGAALGKAEGKKETKIKIAKAMVKEKIDVESIVKCTGLTIKEIEELK